LKFINDLLDGNNITLVCQLLMMSLNVHIDKIRCGGKTLQGKECSRYSIDGEKYCKQHSKPHVQKDSHPPFKIMIGKAIKANAERKGTSRIYIKKYLETNFKIEPTSPFINKTLKTMLESGELTTNPYHTGHYRLSSGFKKELLV
jgi:linker histone H1 and H5 family